MGTTSVWKLLSEKISFPSLKENIEVDIAIIGEGIKRIKLLFFC